MAVEIGDKIPGSKLSISRQGRRIVRRYREKFFVYSDTLDTGPIEVAIETGLATMRQFYQTDREFDIGAIVDQIEINQDEEEPQKYLCEVSYSTDVEDSLTGDKSGGDTTGNFASGGNLRSNPLKRPQVVTYSRRARKTPMEYDYSNPNKAIVNAVGEKFDPPYEYDVYNRVITIKKNTLSYSRDLAERLEDGCNKTIWCGYDPYTARLIEWIAEEKEEDGWVFFENKWEIEIQKPSWKLRLLNEGTSYITNNGKHRRIVDSAGLSVDGKFFLDERGFKLPRTQSAADVGPMLDTVTPVSMEGIVAGMSLLVGIDKPAAGATAAEEVEEVEVISITGTTFDAIFASAHSSPCPITGVPVFLEFKPFPEIDFKKLKILI